MSKHEAADYEFHRHGMWEPDDTYRAKNRLLRDIRDGKPPRDVPTGMLFRGNDRTYQGA